MDLSGVVSTAALINGAINSIKNARELMASTSEPLLRDQINIAYDSLLDLKGRLLDQDDEIRQLKTELERKGTYTGPIAPHGYYYVEDGTDSTEYPLCPVCFQANPQQIAYMGCAENASRGLRRTCKLNHAHMIWERQPDSSQNPRVPPLNRQYS